MKIRKGFVSNSSSSSFMCDISGDIESGWDMGIEEAGMYQCVCGHSFNEEYLLDMTIENKIKILREIAENGYDVDEAVVILDGEELTNKYKVIALSCLYDSELKKEDIDINYINHYDMPIELCPICNMKNVPDYIVLKYLMKKYGKGKDEIIQELKDNFKTSDDVDNYCDGK